MRYVNATTGVALFGLALAQLWLLDDPAAAFLFAFGAVLALLAAKHWLHGKVVRLLAFLAAGAMFCFFWQFFSLTPMLQAGWYLQPGMVNVVGLLFAGFGMMPVVSEYTGRMKANGKGERARRKAASVPLLASLRALASRQTT